MPPAASPKIILGSSSQTRRTILKSMGYDFIVMTADIDESAIRREKPEELVMALAEAKAEAIIAKLGKNEHDYSETSPDQIILITADQIVVHEGTIREKPRNEEEARKFIQGYSRSPAITVGAVFVTNLSSGFKKGGVDRAEVYFHPIPEHVIDALILEGTVFYAAGGLLVEHPLVSPLVEAMVGSLDSVMGLPKDLTLSLIDEALQSTKSL
ncbi:hypothetical protein O6H91_17G059900 [Diphasiastrum complanatum]|uniref:Uncharacterized protein n=1 Tax=Diphasiastrum complanatum TaxID=34168 RepID=A0ACC2B785_DIPCM|nr:hypothetical protein O6H91_17G059900 [Diphasiastrum complanatum]